MCFAPQQRALSGHLNYQKCSEPTIINSFDTLKRASRHNAVDFLNSVLCAFWLQNVLRATTACTFSASQLPKALWSWGVLCIFTRRCSSRHNAVHFLNISTSKNAPALKCVAHFYSHLTRWLRTCRFSEPTIRASWASKHWEKHSVARFFFSRTLSLFLLTVSLLALSLGSDSSHLCFSICPYCRKFDF